MERCWGHVRREGPGGLQPHADPAVLPPQQLQLLRAPAQLLRLPEGQDGPARPPADRQHARRKQGTVEGILGRLLLPHKESSTTAPLRPRHH
eukprot:scaffold870_cov268-Pinguiococcus_pyrenoidosus.AAC.96